MKKITTVLMLALVLFLSGCSASTDKGDDVNKITIWAWDESFNIRAVEEAKAFYEGDYEVEVVTMAQDDIVQKLNTTLSSNSVEGLPNIVLIEDYKIQGYLESYVDAFADLNDVVDDSKFADYKLAVTKKDGINYGVPFDSGVAALFYRTDLFEEAGYTHEDMVNITWEEFTEMGIKVEEKTGVKLMTLDPSDIGQIRIMMQSAGAWYVDENENVTLKDNKALIEAAKIYKNLIDSGTIKTTSNWDEFVGAFNQEEVASVTTGAWIASSIRNGEDQSGNWAVAPVPNMGSHAGSINASNIGGSSWYVLKDVEGLENAKDFLSQTIASNLDLMNSLAKEINLVSTIEDAITLDNYKVEDEFFSNQPVMELFSQWTSEIPSVNFGYNTYLIEDIVAAHLMNYVNGTEDINTVLEAAQAEAESALGN